MSLTREPQEAALRPWGSFAETPERANGVILDLDPGPGVAFDEVKKAARDVGKLLQDAGLTSFLRTTGGKACMWRCRSTPAVSGIWQSQAIRCAREGASVAMPLRRSQLPGLEATNQLDLRDVPG